VSSAGTRPLSRLTVHLGHYAENLRTLRARLPEGCQLMPVVKSDGYGHGAAAVARRAVTEGANMLAVASVGEGIALREAGIQIPILVLVHTRDDDLPAAVHHGLRLSISDFQTAERLGDIARKAHTVMHVHCEIDTGMGRQGFAVENAVTELRNLTRISHVDIEGIYTHFATADTPEDGFAEAQLRAFKQLIRELDKEGVPYEMAHAANSGGVIFMPASALDLVRAGLVAYGVWPGKVRPVDCPFRPVASWTTNIVLVRQVAVGTSISYGRTYFAPTPLRIAAVPIGYADGYPIALSNKADVLVRGKRCPIRGRVTMNEILIDVTHVPDAVPGDRVTLIGTEAGETITVEELAAKGDLVPHSILTGISPRVARDYIV
jgi:alanine racemase